MTKTKLLYLGVGIFIALFVLVFTFNLKYFFLCSDHYIVNCWRESGLLIQVSPPISTTEEYIPCSNNNDCSVEIMQNFCSLGGHANLLKCDGARYYCEDDGYCKGCVCPWYSPARWLSVIKK